MYEIDTETGLLDKKFTLPLAVTIQEGSCDFPGHKHIAVANHASNTVTTFTVDYDKNIIVMNDKPHHIETPNSIHIWPVPDEVAPEGDQSEEQEEFE